MELDLFTSIPGFEKDQFSELIEIAPIAEIENVPVPFLHLNHLLHSKRISNLSVDPIDIEALEEIRQLRKD